MVKLAYIPLRCTDVYAGLDFYQATDYCKIYQLCFKQLLMKNTPVKTNTQLEILTGTTTLEKQY